MNPFDPQSYRFLGILFLPFFQVFAGIMLSAVPFRFLAARLNLDALSTLLVSVFAAFAGIYLLEWMAYLLALPQWLVLFLYLALLIFSLRKTRSARNDFSWDGIRAWSAVSIWILGLQAFISVYGSSGWYGDWYEHYERSIFFLDRLPVDSRFLHEMWSLAARGPLFNSVCAFFMNTGRDFASYQVFATVLNTSVVLPLALLIRDMANTKQSTALLCSVVICAIAPFAVQQETYTWTKSVATAFILGGIHFYRLGFLKDEPRLFTVSFLFFAVGIIAHYLVFLFVIFFAAHFIFRVMKHHVKPAVLIRIVVLCTAVLSTWFAFAFPVFGIKGTLQSTSTFGDYIDRQKSPGSEVPPWKIVFIGNMTTTLVPYNWRHGWTDPWKGIGKTKRLIQRDPRMAPQHIPADDQLDLQSEWFAALVTHPNSLPGCLGLAGIIALVVASTKAAGQRILSGKSDAQSRRFGPSFWFIFFLLGIPLNILASRDYSPFGVAHLNLQPFVFLIAVFLIRTLKDSTPTFKFVIVFLFLLESSLISGAIISLQSRKLPISLAADQRPVAHAMVHAEGRYVNNYVYKLQSNAVFLSDKLGRFVLAFFLIATLISIELWSRLLQSRTLRLCSADIQDNTT